MLGWLADIDHLRGHDALGAVEGREGLGELGHVAADGGVPLDQHHLVAAVGDIEGRLDAGDAAADDQGPLGDRHGDRLELAVLLHPLDEHGDDVGRLGGGLFPVLVDPGAVLADVGHLAQVRVQAGGSRRLCGRSSRACGGSRRRRRRRRGCARLTAFFSRFWPGSEHMYL